MDSEALDKKVLKRLAADDEVRAKANKALAELKSVCDQAAKSIASKYGGKSVATSANSYGSEIGVGCGIHWD